MIFSKYCNFFRAISHYDFFFFFLSSSGHNFHWLLHKHEWPSSVHSQALLYTAERKNERENRERISTMLFSLQELVMSGILELCMPGYVRRSKQNWEWEADYAWRIEKPRVEEMILIIKKKKERDRESYIISWCFNKTEIKKREIH